ncbi:MAG: hemimethylated DNA-binding YccV-like domain-containing protein, partial [bacterium]
RLGLDISGCDFPDHFLARVREAGREYLVDCFNGGTEVDHKVAASGAEASPWGVQEALNREARPRGIVARLLRNLAKAFEESRQPEDLGLMAELSVRLERDDLGRSAAKVQGSDAPDGPRFQTGTVVLTRAGLRAVVVDFDLSCKTPESWRRRQDGQSLDQTWYHLFLDQSDEVAYAPEDTLEPESPPGRIEHPLMPVFFGRYANGKYWRNLKVWPGT